jgi:hypothetical protein
MLPATLFTAYLVTVSASVSALALPHRQERDARLTIAVPLNGLPAPSTISPAVTLKYVTLGVGTQNYTCAATPNSASVAPASNGAKAALYDAGSYLQSHSNLIASLPGMALNDPKVPTKNGLKSIGQHFFNAALSPIFDLTSVKGRLVAKRLGSVPAPPGSCPGKDGDDAGAIDWLQLTDNGAGQSFGGVTYVYRVETAGGKSPVTCEGETGSFEVPYAAEYWFFGP